MVKDVIMNPESRNYTTLNGNEDTVLVEFCKNFAENMGIAVAENLMKMIILLFIIFIRIFAVPVCSSMEDVSVERHAAKESYAGVCDDIKVGVTLIFYLQNMIPYIKYRNTDKLPVRGTSLTLSALGIQGSIMMPIIRVKIRRKKYSSLP